MKKSLLKKSKGHRGVPIFNNIGKKPESQEKSHTFFSKN